MGLNYINRIKIKNAKVISFDIFDTLLLRPFYEPQNAFDFLGEILEEPDFGKIRKSAEQELRVNENNNYPNFDEIYSHLPQKFSYIKEIERNLEKETLFANPNLKEIYNYAQKLGKKIIIVSDMYYDPNTLKDFLNKNGYFGFSQIYVSAYEKKSKYEGALFNKILEDLKIKPSDMLHIGDNKISDYKSPKKKGIKTILISAPNKTFYKRNKRFREFITKNKGNLTAGIILGLTIKKTLLNKELSSNYWEDFGYFWGGPFIYALSNFCIQSMKKDKIDNLICVARDGYSVEKVIKLIAPEIKTNYIYAGRSINLLISLDCCDKLAWTHKSYSLICLYRELSEDFNKKCYSVDLSKAENRVKLINDNKEILAPISEQIYNSYIKYLSSFNLKDSKLAMFDISGGEFNSYKLLKRTLPNCEIVPHYWYAIKNNSIPFKRLSENKGYKVKNYELLEFIVTAPELPIKSIDANVNFIRVENKYENIRKDCYCYVSNGEIEWSKDFLKTYKNLISFEPQILCEYLNIFCNHPTKKDFKFFAKIYQGIDEAHTIYRKILTPKNNLLQSIFSSKNCGKHKVLTILGIKIKFKRTKYEK